MKLKHITFTGIDWRTSLDELLEIQREWPIVEFGVLASYHWSENGNRYLSPDIIRGLRGRGLNLSLHLCGSAAHDAAVGEWEKIEDLLGGSLDVFQRIQLNISERKDNPEHIKPSPLIGQEVIIQCKGTGDTSIYDKTAQLAHLYRKLAWCSLLLDASGGHGIEAPIQILNAPKVGYAGGINPENVGDKLRSLLENPKVQDFWIDMESGVRTDDWFDADKVWGVLNACAPIIQEYLTANR